MKEMVGREKEEIREERTYFLRASAKPRNNLTSHAQRERRLRSGIGPDYLWSFCHLVSILFSLFVLIDNSSKELICGKRVCDRQRVRKQSGGCRLKVEKSARLRCQSGRNIEPMTGFGSGATARLRVFHNHSSLFFIFIFILEIEQTHRL
jgi:hypothetical protein